MRYSVPRAASDVKGTYWNAPERAVLRDTFVKEGIGLLATLAGADHTIRAFASLAPAGYQLSSDHTAFDIRFFLDGTIDFGTLDPVFTDGVIFRVAIIPADFASTLDVNKFEDVMRALKVDEVKRVN